MKTISIVTEKPQLKITYDQYAENPRNDSNISLLVLKGLYGDTKEELKKLLNETYNKADNAKHHLELMKKEVADIYGKVVFVDFVTKYEHSGVCLKRGQYKGFDYGLIGFVFVTEHQMQSFGIDLNKIEELIDSELETYNQWINGEVYEYYLYDNEGEVVDSCSGFYDMESIKGHLPNDWQEEDMEIYFSATA